MQYFILFSESTEYKVKYSVLKTIINLYNQGVSNLTLVAELTKCVVEIDKINKTATYTCVGV